MPGLTASIRSEAGVTVLALAGVADATTLHRLHDALEDVVLVDPCAPVVVDVGGLTRVSTVALVSLVRASQDAVRHGTPLVVCRLGRVADFSVRDLRIRALLVEYDGVDEAVRSVGPRRTTRPATGARHRRAVSL